MQLRADDRVLLLAPASSAELAVFGRILVKGVLVVLAESDEISSLRSQLAECENILLLEASPDRIPWRDHYFTKIVIPPQLERVLPSVSGELSRVLAPEGELVRSAVLA
jgi:hypothetical protein